MNCLSEEDLKTTTTLLGLKILKKNYFQVFPSHLTINPDFQAKRTFQMGLWLSALTNCVTELVI